MGLTATCNHKHNTDLPTESSRIEINAPVPTVQISTLGLNKSQQDCVDSANAFAFKCLQTLYDENGETNIVFSPLSLQYALAMALNGATGETAEEILKSFGYSGDKQNLNSFMNFLLEQLPAIDTSIVLRAANVMLVNNSYKVDSSFVNILNNEFYSPVEYVDLSTGKKVAERINEWASRNTNGFINPFIENSDIQEDFVASLLNALYFKAKWSGNMFHPKGTLLSQPFYLNEGGEVSVDYLRTSSYLRYSKFNGYRVVELPYANGKFSLFVLLPDSNETFSLKQLLDTLSEEEWKHITNSLKTGPEVHLRLPKFEIENRFDLPNTLKRLGIRKAFVPGQAEFDKMFEPSGSYSSFWIGNVIQKARIKVTEWGTEAAAVTAVVMIGEYIPEDYKEVYFYADHPFAYIIAERDTDIVLFEGVYTGKKQL